ncbi:MAG: hypothetical protein ACOYUZ_01120 [Patescibacteria group bacterium]
MVKPLVHKKTGQLVEEVNAEAEEYLKRQPAYRFMKHFIASARYLNLWSTDQELELLSISDRFQALETRPDIRANIMNATTGMFTLAASTMPLALQVEILQGMIKNNVMTAGKLLDIIYDSAPIVYFEVSSFYGLWQSQKEKILKEKSDVARKFFTELLTSACACGWHWEVRYALRHAWHMYIPIEMREKADLIRLEQERKNQRVPFTAKQELEIITPEIIMQDLPLADFAPVLEMIEKRLGIGESEIIDHTLLEVFAGDEPPSSRPEPSSQKEIPRAHEQEDDPAPESSPKG